MTQVRNETKGTVVASQARVAASIQTRFWGLLGHRSLPDGHGLLLRPSSSIHTAFMRFAIDVVFLDKQGRVVKVVPELKPFRLAGCWRGAHSALELPVGAAAASDVEQGDQLLISADGVT